MDTVDRQQAECAYQRATTAPVGETITWSNPNTGNSGSVTPTREGTSSTGAYCREFQQTVTIGGKERSEEHTSELQSLMRISYAVFCLKTKNRTHYTELTEVTAADGYQTDIHKDRANNRLITRTYQ